MKGFLILLHVAFVLAVPAENNTEVIQPKQFQILTNLIGGLLGGGGAGGGVSQSAGNGNNYQVPPTSDCGCGERNQNTRIVGGDVSSPHEFPWGCYLATNMQSFFCGCSIISSNHIMTAAHCIKGVQVSLAFGDKIKVVVGAYDRAQPNANIQKSIVVDKILTHPRYSSSTYDYDMSILKVSTPISFNGAVSPVCLPWNFKDASFEGEYITASGWGHTTEGGKTSPVNRKVDLPIWPSSQCAKSYPGKITKNMICTYLPGKDTCQGDSGGGIVWKNNENNRHYAIGVTSFGIGCARQNYPGVYAKVDQFLGFIQQVTAGERFCNPY